jgi:predicted  nucleic acid-binding Zn-ribbon protein
MNRKNTSILISALILFAIISLMNFGTVNAATKAKAQTPQAKAATEINSRINALNSLLVRVQQMSKLSAVEQTQLANELTNDVNQMVVLKTKIASDADAATLKSDMQSVTKAYRVYALDLPKGRIEAAVDRIENIVVTMNDLGAKLQARITAAQSAGNNVAGSQTAYTDFQSKVADAQKQAQSAISATSGLVPDNGSATILQSNNKALKAAAAQIKTAMTDLSQARKDAATIVSGLKSPSTTTTTPKSK